MGIGGARLTRRTAVPLVVVLALVAGLSAYLVGAADGRPASRCERYRTASAERLALDSGSGTERTVVIGDSYSVGLHLDRPLDSWPSRLPGRVHVAGFSGSGFAGHPCGDTSYADRAAAAVGDGADLVVVEGGLNDTGYDDAAIAAGFDRLMTVLDGYPALDVLVVGPPPAPTRGLPVAHVDALLARLSATHDVGYLSMLDADLPYLDDGLHLTAAGHRAFGDAVAARASDLVGAPVSP